MSYTFPSCVPVDFPASDANSAHSPPSGILRPLRSFRHWGNSPQPTVPQNHASPLVAPRKPRVAGFHPRWGTTRPARTEAGSGHTGPSLAERKENDPARKAVASADGAYASVWLLIRLTVSSKTSSGERCEKRAGERPGVAGASPAGSPRPAEPVVPGFFPGVNFPIFRGRFGGLGVTTGVRKRKFPGGKPFFRVSPPGSTKG